MLKFSGVALTGKLAAINLMMIAALVAVVGLAWQLLPGERAAAAEVALLTRAQHLSQHAGMLHDALRGDVMGALLVDQAAGLSGDAVRSAVQSDAREYSADLNARLDQFRSRP